MASPSIDLEIKMSHNKLLLFLFVLAIIFAFTACLPLSASAIENEQTNLQNQIDDFFVHLTNENGFSGAVLVAQDDQILLQEGYGSANMADGSFVTPDTVFDIGSISKQFTAAAILLLEQRGLLRVNDPISKYFNDVPSDKANITIHQLLTHSAGFTRDHFEGDLIPMTRDEAQEAIFALPLGYQPGTNYNYSNTGYTLLAILIEKVTGMPYTSYLKQTFFDRLGMDHTGFYNDENWASLSVANTYFNGIDEGKPSEWPGPYWGVMGNGGVLSTVGDLFIWWKSLQNHNILSLEQTDKLFTRYISEGSADSFYGYGWSIQESPYGNLITHNGGGIGGNSDLAVYTNKGLIIIICSNRIVWRTFFGSIPYEIRMPATETREQLAQNIFDGDFSKLPKPTFLLLPILSVVIIVVIGVVSLVVFLYRSNRMQKKINSATYRAG
jgi:CubicO group peptidase (beta-lactamase class C family)